MTDETITILAYIGFYSLFLGLLPLLVIIIIGFRYVVLIESRVANDAGGTATARMLWKEGVIGRFIRSSNVFAYVLLRSFPGPFFKQRAALLGDPDVNLPKIWQAWVLVQALFLFGMLAIALIASAILRAFV